MTGEHHYTVSGMWPFPLDMLRRDGSRPASPEDEQAVSDYSREHAPDRDFLHRPVEIKLVGPNKPCTDRWESFGWSVPTDEEHAMFKAMRRRQADDEKIRAAALAKLTPDERRVLGV